MILAKIKSTSTVMQSEIVFQKNMKTANGTLFGFVTTFCCATVAARNSIAFLPVFTELASNYE